MKLVISITKLVRRILRKGSRLFTLCRLAIVPVFLFMVITTGNTIWASEPKINIVTTFKPVNMIVHAIADEKAVIHQLIPDNASPHFYALKPSSMRKIKQAKLIFRIAENMEMMLNPVLKKSAIKPKVISLSEQGNIQFLALSSDHSDHAHTHDHHEDEAHKKMSMMRKNMKRKPIIHNTIHISGQHPTTPLPWQIRLPMNSAR